MLTKLISCASYVTVVVLQASCVLVPRPEHAGAGSTDYYRASYWCRGDKALQVGAVV